MPAFPETVERRLEAAGFVEVAVERSGRGVGAGPAGMTLAYLLARRGVEVTVLETHLDFARAFRGEGLQRSGIDTVWQRSSN